MAINIVSLNVAGKLVGDRSFSETLGMHHSNYLVRCIREQDRKAIVCLQETHLSSQSDSDALRVKWGATPSYWTFNPNTASQGVATLFPNKRFDVLALAPAQSSRLQIFLLSSGSVKIYLCNIYAPVQDAERLGFYETLLHNVESVVPDGANLILCGDFNFHLLPTDANSPTRRTAPPPSFEALCSRYSLTDVASMTEDGKKANRFKTFQRVNAGSASGLVESRVDYFFVSRPLVAWNPRIAPWNKYTSRHLNSPLSDHLGIKLTLTPPSYKRGPGRWRMRWDMHGKNPDYLHVIHNTILSWRKEWPPFASDHILRIDALKRYLQTALSAWERDFRRKSKSAYWAAMKSLERLIDAYSQGELEREAFLHQRDSLYRTLRERMPEFCKSFCQTEALFSSKVEATSSHEFFDHYFGIDTESSDPTKLRPADTSDPSEASDDPLILMYLSAAHFAELYDGQQAQESVALHRDERDSCAPLYKPYKLLEREALDLDAPLTSHELLQAFKDISGLGKSPGLDGLAPEFYVAFWDEIKRDFVLYLREMQRRKVAPASLRDILIVPIPKPGTDATLITNRRPIALSNVEERAIERALSNRLTPIMPRLISKYQSGFITRRSAVHQFMLVYLLMFYEGNNPELEELCLGFLDFSKAYDRVNWEFLFWTLQQYGFGPGFIDWVRLLYSDLSGMIYINDWTSPRFPIRCGVRQGGPLSPYLYNLCAHLLIMLIDSEPRLKGVRISKTDICKVVQFADDTVPLIAALAEIPIWDFIFKKYQRLTGAKINLDKSRILPLRPNLVLPDDCPFERMKVDPSEIAANSKVAKYLGFPLEMVHDRFWNKKTAALVLRAQSMNRSRMPLRSGILLAWAAIAGALHYPLYILEPEEHRYKSWSNLIRNFSGVRGSVSPYVTSLPFNDGGLNCPDIKRFSLALKSKWLAHLNDPACAAPWKQYLQYQIDTQMRPFEYSSIVLMLDMPSVLPMLKLPPLWKMLFEAWRERQALKFPPSVAETLTHPLFFNPLIKLPASISRAAMVELAREGCLRIRDIWDPTRRAFRLPSVRIRESAELSAAFEHVCRALPPTFLTKLGASLNERFIWFKSWDDRFVYLRGPSGSFVAFPLFEGEIVPRVLDFVPLPRRAGSWSGGRPPDACLLPGVPQGLYPLYVHHSEYFISLRRGSRPILISLGMGAQALLTHTDLAFTFKEMLSLGAFSVRLFYKLEVQRVWSVHSRAKMPADHWGFAVPLQDMKQLAALRAYPMLWLDALFRLRFMALPSLQRPPPGKEYCRICNDGHRRSVRHVFFECPLARQFWQEVNRTLSDLAEALPEEVQPQLPLQDISMMTLVQVPDIFGKGSIVKSTVDADLCLRYLGYILAGVYAIYQVSRSYFTPDRLLTERVPVYSLASMTKVWHRFLDVLEITLPPAVARIELQRERLQEGGAEREHDPSDKPSPPQALFSAALYPVRGSVRITALRDPAPAVAPPVAAAAQPAPAPAAPAAAIVQPAPAPANAAPGVFDAPPPAAAAPVVSPASTSEGVIVSSSNVVSGPPPPAAMASEGVIASLSDDNVVRSEYTCPVCGNRFETPADRDRHVRADKHPVHLRAGAGVVVPRNRPPSPPPPPAPLPAPLLRPSPPPVPPAVRPPSAPPAPVPPPARISGVRRLRSPANSAGNVSEPDMAPSPQRPRISSPTDMTPPAPFTPSSLPPATLDRNPPTRRSRPSTPADPEPSFSPPAQRRRLSPPPTGSTEFPPASWRPPVPAWPPPQLVDIVSIFASQPAPLSTLAVPLPPPVDNIQSMLVGSVGPIHIPVPRSLRAFPIPEIPFPLPIALPLPPPSLSVDLQPHAPLFLLHPSDRLSLGTDDRRLVFSDLFLSHDHPVFGRVPRVYPTVASSSIILPGPRPSDEIMQSTPPLYLLHPFDRSASIDLDDSTFSDRIANASMVFPAPSASTISLPGPSQPADIMRAPESRQQLQFHAAISLPLPSVPSASTSILWRRAPTVAPTSLRFRPSLSLPLPLYPVPVLLSSRPLPAAIHVLASSSPVVPAVLPPASSSAVSSSSLSSSPPPASSYLRKRVRSPYNLRSKRPLLPLPSSSKRSRK